MFKKSSKILNKYYLHIIIALILASVAWAIVFYFHCNNKEQAIQKSLDSALNKEPQREFYTIIPGPEYFNKKYGF
jgi:flagellar basal body-associated protein FliL